jgi:hypothetical protein
MTGPVEFVGSLCAGDVRGVQTLVNVLRDLVVGKLNEAIAHWRALDFVSYQFHGRDTRNLQLLILLVVTYALK